MARVWAFTANRSEPSPYYYATWFDEHTRQTRRSSLGTEDVHEAEIKLAEFVTLHATMKSVPQNAVELSTVFVRYWNEHASKLPSQEQARIALGYWTEFWKDAKVSDLTVVRQEQFMSWLKNKGFKNSYVSRILSVGRAALQRAWKCQEIERAPFILDDADRSNEEKAYKLNDCQLAKLLDTAKQWPHLYSFCVIMLNTLSRPCAVLDLRPSQKDFDAMVINLNPEGRKQTKKHRPKVPLTETLRPFVSDKSCVRFVTWEGKPIRSIKKLFKRAAELAGLPREVSPYSLRHTMAGRLRNKYKVDKWEVSGLLGHSLPNAKNH